MKVRLLLFANAREAVGASSVLLDFASPRREESSKRNETPEEPGRCHTGNAGTVTGNKASGNHEKNTSHLQTGNGPPLPNTRRSSPSTSVSLSLVFSLIAEQVPSLEPLLPLCALAVDHMLVHEDEEIPISAESELALLPPVSGG